ncbi:MAG TPA: UDP-3-O-(3-hydroxymyristoyl)glucosamine N-acyltransferase [Steroidobacteraceae bacterium]|nr:UDP-3-O-(3-hydroxymyristoyl)glucosamine N-acyltransferase [Steroidobacteraceae bacterium]
MAVSLGELAVRLGCELRGDPALLVDGVATLADAHPRSVAFLAERRHLVQLAGTRAGAVVLEARHAAACPVAALISANPRATYARLAALLHPIAAAVPGVHPTAVVAADARVDPSAEIGPCAVVGSRAVIGRGVRVGAHCVIEEDVQVGAETVLHVRVTLRHGVSLGPRCILHPGAVVGADGFGFAPEAGAWVKIPQVGGVRVGADVEIGANTTVDRGTIGDTVVEDGVKLDNQIQIGHNVRVGEHTAIAGCTGVSGSTVIGRRCQIGGACAIGGHLSIADDVVITGFSMISRSILRPGVYSSGIPFEDARTWRRLVARFKRPGAARAPGDPARGDDSDDAPHREDPHREE